ncbi:MAG: glycosyltransferase [Candidatus Peribacteraceae bacterium]
MHSVDVLIPTYKPQREHLTVALSCLQKQTFTSFKAFIHDDHVPESEAMQIVQPFMHQIPLLYQESDRRLGIGGNWNACVRRTAAEYVAFLFQDDLWEPHYLENAVKILRSHPSVGFVSMEHDYVPEGGQELGPIYSGVQEFRQKHIRPGLHIGRECLRMWVDHELTPNFIGEPSFVVMRRTAMKEAGIFLEDMPQFLDSEYWLRLLQVSDWYNLLGTFGAFRVHPAAATARNEASGAGIFDRLRCFQILISNLGGDDKTLAKKARQKALDGMIKKFFDRRKEGKKVGGGSGMMKKILLRHPLLIGGAVLRHFFQKLS